MNSCHCGGGRGHYFKVSSAVFVQFSSSLLTRSSSAAALTGRPSRIFYCRGEIDLIGLAIPSARSAGLILRDLPE
jgi:hypothetical protein